MYATVWPKEMITLCLEYRLNGWWETLTIGRYGASDGISLLLARVRCAEVRRAIAAGFSLGQEKQYEKRHLSKAKTFEAFANRWLEGARMAETTKAKRNSILDRSRPIVHPRSSPLGHIPRPSEAGSH